MVINDFRDVSRELATIRRRLTQIEVELRARQAGPDDAGALIDRLIGQQLAELERAVAADLAFEDELAAPVRAVRSR